MLSEFGGEWRRWLAHQSGGLGVAGSSPVSPTKPWPCRHRRCRRYWGPGTVAGPPKGGRGPIGRASDHLKARGDPLLPTVTAARARFGGADPGSASVAKTGFRASTGTGRSACLHPSALPPSGSFQLGRAAPPPPPPVRAPVALFQAPAGDLWPGATVHHARPLGNCQHRVSQGWVKPGRFPLDPGDGVDAATHSRPAASPAVAVGRAGPRRPLGPPDTPGDGLDPRPELDRRSALARAERTV